MNVHERVYRSLLVMHPKAHRREYGEPDDPTSAGSLPGRRRRHSHSDVVVSRSRAIWQGLHSPKERRQLWTLSGKDGGASPPFSSAPRWRLSPSGTCSVAGSTTDPRYGKIGASVVTLTAAALVFGGIAIRRRRPYRGSMMIGVGVLPAVTLISVPWFPLLAAAGVLAGVVAVAAFVNAASHQRCDTAEASVSSLRRSTTFSKQRTRG